MILYRDCWTWLKASRGLRGESCCVSHSSRLANSNSNLVAEAENLAKAGQVLPEEVLGMLGDLAGSVTDAVDLAVQVCQLTYTFPSTMAA
jgi:hypothetical protein